MSEKVPAPEKPLSLAFFDAIRLEDTRALQDLGPENVVRFAHEYLMRVVRTDASSVPEIAMLDHPTTAGAESWSALRSYCASLAPRPTEEMNAEEQARYAMLLINFLNDIWFTAHQIYRGVHAVFPPDQPRTMWWHMDRAASAHDHLKKEGWDTLEVDTDTPVDREV